MPALFDMKKALDMLMTVEGGMVGALVGALLGAALVSGQARPDLMRIEELG